MKKLGVFLAVCLLVCATAGRASAYFTDGDLIRVMYDTKTGVEIASDLGALSSFAGKTNLTAGGTISLSSFGAGAVWGDIQTAYFAKATTGGVAPFDAYLSGTGTMTSASRVWNGFNANVTSIEGYYAGLGTTSTVIGSTTAPNSYYLLMNKSGATPGQMGGFLSVYSNTEVNNASPVDQYLYNFHITSINNPVTTGTAGITIRTTNGVTTINPAAVPIPPSVLLMGSGLLGLIGVGRSRLFA